MSINLPTQDFTSAVVGSTGKIPLKPFSRAGSIGNKLPQVVFLNESGVGLEVNFQGSNREMVLPAGVWSKPVPVYNSDNTINYTVLYVLPNSPVAALYTIYYDAGETPLEIAALGNSPIGISGNVTTANIQSITNDNNPAPTSIIESTPSGQGSSSFSLNNDGSGFWQTLSANTLKKIINVVRGTMGVTKAVIDIGDATDLSITTFHGQLDTGVVLPGAQVTGTVPNASELTAAMTARDDPTFHFYGPSPFNKPAAAPRGFNVECWDGTASHFQSLFDGSGNFIASVPGTQITGAIPLSTNANNLLDNDSNPVSVLRTGSGSNLFTLINVPQINSVAYNFGARVWDGTTSHDTIVVNSDGSEPVTNFDTSVNAQLRGIQFSAGGTLTAYGIGNGSGSATVNHGVSGGVRVALMNNVAGSNSTTFGSGSYTSTQVFIYQSVGMSWSATFPKVL